jgi:hypothetical protein
MIGSRGGTFFFVFYVSQILGFYFTLAFLLIDYLCLISG